MTSLETLRKIFKSSFDYTTYSNEIVHHLFGCNDVATNPELLDTNADGDKSYFIGQMEDTDGRLLGFFYTRVADGGDVRRKRVGLRKLIQPYLKYDVDGAIAVFDDGNHWRLSYICDLKEGNTAAKRFSYILGEEQGQYKTPIERLGKVAEKNGRFKLSDLREAFSVDALSKEFFDEYHRHYDRICDYIIHSHINTLTHLHIHDYVKKMMGRIVFLHFLQKKGWLNGNLAFLRDLFFFSPHQGNFLGKVLKPLFFGIFNTEPQNREKVFLENDWDLSLLKEWNGGSTNAFTHSHIDALPYLNGGLFERDAVDEQNITLPASLFEDLFTFMASYNFTVDENDPDDAEVGVDPEMLGKIFESLLEDNKAKGAFYTPKEIVRYMCKESLIAYLSSRVSETPSPSGRDLVNLVDSADTPNCERSNANNNLQDQQDFASATSRSIRAFVEHHEMQPELEPYREALDTALREVKICDPAIGSGAFPMGLLNELWRCREALYYPSPAGRDLVNLIDSADASNCERSNAKDNLQDQQDFVSAASRKNEYSRSQLKKEIIENNIYGVDIEKGAIDIARLRFWLSIVVDADKPEPLPNFDYKFMQGNSLIESFEGFDLSRISSRLRGGQSKSMQLVLGIDSHTSRQNLQRLLREYFSVTDHKQKASMRQAINEEVKTLIRESIGGTPASLAKLEKMDCSANKDFFLWHTWFKDIFDNGGFDIVIGNPPYVVVEANGKYSNYETESCYDLYAYFFERAVKLLNSSGVLSFITSSLYVKGLKYTTLRSFLQNNTSLIAFRIEGDDVFKNAGIPTATLIANKAKGQWKFEDLYMDQGLTEKIRKGTVPLSSVSSIMRGFEIGRNMVDSVGQYKFLTGSDVSKYCYNKLSYISHSVLNAFSKDVRYFSKERILLRETGSFLTAVYLGNETIYSNRSLYSILISDRSLNTKFVLALLNSSLLQWYYSNMFKGDTELFPKIRIAQAKQLPIIKVTAEQQQPIIELIDKILAQKQSSPNADTSSLENEIDKLVYQLYNLTPEEIAVIGQN